MIDYDDVDDASWMALFVESPIGIILVLVLVVGLYFIAQSNEDECLMKTCPIGATVKLQNHACQCVTEAK
jgi:hypothetical protein